MAAESITCEGCGTSIENPHRSQKYCSDNCGQATCEHCGEEFSHHPGRDRTYCSKECYLESRRSEAETDICEYCEEEYEHPVFLEPRFCSEDCHRRAEEDGFVNHTSPQQKVERTTTDCENCGEEIKHRVTKERTYCSRECFKEGLSKYHLQRTVIPAKGTEVYEILAGHGGRRKAAGLLIEAGYKTEEDIRQADPSELLEIKGIGKGTVSELCRNLDHPWETPFQYGPSPPERQSPSETHTPAREMFEDADGDEDRAPVSPDQGPACNEPLQGASILDHGRNCDEIGGEITYTDPV